MAILFKILLQVYAHFRLPITKKKNAFVPDINISVFFYALESKRKLFGVAENMVG